MKQVIIILTTASENDSSSKNVCWVTPGVRIGEGALQKHYPDIYEITYIQRKSCVDSYTPIYNQIIDLEAIELHKAQKLLTKYNGFILEVNTDCAVAEFKSIRDIKNCKKEIDSIFWDDDEQVKKYKWDEKLMKRYHKVFPCETKYVYQKPEYKIITDPGYSTPHEFKSFVKTIVDMNSSMQIGKCRNW